MVAGIGGAMTAQHRLAWTVRVWSGERFWEVYSVVDSWLTRVYTEGLARAFYPKEDNVS
jgi:hypothetical protein